VIGRRLKTKVNIDHCNTYYEIDFSSSNLVLKVCGSVVIQDNLLKGCHLRILMTLRKEPLLAKRVWLKKCDKNPIRPFVLDHLKEKAEELYHHPIKDSTNEDFIAEKITQDIDQLFSFGCNLFWNDTLNHWLVNFNIIQIQKNHMGYTYWKEVPMNQRELCYRGYIANNEHPCWNIDQERY
jgi:hypothetical protein